MASFFSYLKTRPFPTRDIRRTFVSFSFFFKVGIICLFFVTLFFLYNSVTLLSKIASHTRPLRGGTLTEGVIGSPRFITPLFATSKTDEALVQLIYSGLLKKDANGTIVPDSATYTINDDATTYTFHLSPQAFFSDGTRVTSDDVLYTFAMVQSGIGPRTVQDGLRNATCAKVDETTLTCTLPQPDQSFLSALTFGIMPKHYWESIPNESLSSSTQQLHPIGSGAFQLKKIVENNGIPTAILLVRNHHHIPHSYITKYNILIYPNQEQITDALRARSIDMTTAINDFSLFDDSIAKRYKNISTETGEHVAIASLNSSGPLANANFIEALSEMIDKRVLIDTIEDGYGYVDDSSTTNSSHSSFDDLVKTHLLSRAENGALLWQGVPITIVFSVESNSKEARVAQGISDILSPSGITVEVRSYDSGIYRSLVANGEAGTIITSNETDTSAYTTTIPLFTREQPLIIKTTIPFFSSSPLQYQTLYATAGEWFVREERVWNIFK